MCYEKTCGKLKSKYRFRTSFQLVETKKIEMNFEHMLQQNEGKARDSQICSRIVSMMIETESS